MKMISLWEQGKVIDYTMVSDEDFEELNQFKWRKRNGYAVRGERIGGRSGKYNIHQIHRDITECPNNMVVDHINGNKLDNQRCNLRVCSQDDNMKHRNVSKNKSLSSYKGVYRTTNGDTWQVIIQSDKNKEYCGCYKTEIEAAIAYNELAKKLHGEYALLNEFSIDITNVVPIKINNYSNYTSKCQGVGFHSASGKWRARINFKGKQVYIGLFNSENEAYAAYMLKKEELESA